MDYINKLFTIVIDCVIHISLWEYINSVTHSYSKHMSQIRIKLSVYFYQNEFKNREKITLLYRIERSTIYSSKANGFIELREIKGEG